MVRKFNRGYTLIELVVTIAIGLLVLSVTYKIIIQTTNLYFKNIDKNISLDNIDNCLLNIDNLLRSYYVTDIAEESDKVIIYTKLSHNSNTINKKIICIKDNNLMLLTYDSINSTIPVGNNVLLREVKSFKAYRKNKLIYFTIETEKGDIRVRCI